MTIPDTPHVLARYWQGMGISSKLGLSGILFVVLMAMVGTTGYMSLIQIKKAEQAILASSEIQRLVLDMDRGMEKSRRLFGGFFIHYPDLGFKKAHETYVQPSIRETAQTIVVSRTLKTLIESSQVSQALRESHIDLNLYLSSVRRFADTSIASIERVTQRSAPERGYEARLMKILEGLMAKVAPYPDLVRRFHEIRFNVQSYQNVRKRFLMQSAFNAAFQMRQAVASVGMGADLSARIIRALDNAEAMGKQILAADAKIRSMINDIALQEKAIAPISASLIRLASLEMDRAKQRIARTHTLTVLAMVFMGLGGLFGAIGIWKLLDRSITGKLAQLTLAAREFRQGNLDVFVAQDSNDEIGQLAATFTMMALRIRDAIFQLESKVADRTRELKRSNEQLLKEVNDRIQAQAGLKKTQALLQAALDNSQAGILIAEAPGGEVQYINTVCLRIMGENTIPAPFNIFTLPFKGLAPDGTRASSNTSPLALALARGRAVTQEYLIRLPGRPDQHIWANAAPIFNDQGGIHAGICFFLDITEQKLAEKEKKALEAQLHQARKMEAIGTLAGGIAHDFNNILAAIIGYADLALFDLPQDHPAAPQIQEVVKAGNRAKDLVSQILAFSRQSSTGRVQVQVRRILKEALHLLRASIPSTVEIRTDIDTPCPPVMADPTQVHQVILNLCTNGAQAMEETGGTLSISLVPMQLSQANQVRYPELAPGPHVVLNVEDTGPGIAPDIMDRIFDPYFTTKAVGKGSGMGLAMVHGIVARHKGMVQAFSPPGQGARFQVILPGLEAAEPSEPEAPDRPMAGSGRILLVDDEASITEVTQKQLERLGYQVSACTDSLEALALFRSHPHGFDLVITDQTMPQMAGHQMAWEMIRIRPDIPVILCTGYSAVMDRDKAAACGIREFIMKPVDISDLSRAMGRILAN